MEHADEERRAAQCAKLAGGVLGFKKTEQEPCWRTNRPDAESGQGSNSHTAPLSGSRSCAMLRVLGPSFSGREDGWVVEKDSGRQWAPCVREDAEARGGSNGHATGEQHQGGAASGSSTSSNDSLSLQCGWPSRKESARKDSGGGAAPPATTGVGVAAAAAAVAVITAVVWARGLTMTCRPHIQHTHPGRLAELQGHMVGTQPTLHSVRRASGHAARIPAARQLLGWLAEDGLCRLARAYHVEMGGPGCWGRRFGTRSLKSD